MTPERWNQLEQIYNEALEYGPQDRASFVAKACGSDTELRREVETLINVNASEFLEQPAAELAAKDMARLMRQPEAEHVDATGTVLPRIELRL